MLINRKIVIVMKTDTIVLYTVYLHLMKLWNTINKAYWMKYLHLLKLCIITLLNNLVM